MADGAGEKANDGADDGADALAALDRLLADRPHKDSPQFSGATVALARLRDVWIARIRAASHPDDEMARLATMNGVMSALVGVHHPVGAPNWDRLGAARAALANLLG